MIYYLCNKQLNQFFITESPPKWADRLSASRQTNSKCPVFPPCSIDWRPYGRAIPVWLSNKSTVNHFDLRLWAITVMVKSRSSEADTQRTAFSSFTVFQAPTRNRQKIDTSMTTCPRQQSRLLVVSNTWCSCKQRYFVYTNLSHWQYDVH